MSVTTYSDVITGVLREEYAPLKHASEYLARDAGSTPRAAENWLAGVCAPTGEKLLNLMANCEPLRIAVNMAAITRREALREGARAAERYTQERREPGTGNAAETHRVANMEGL